MYGAELEEWTKSSTIFNFADDTSSRSQGKEIGEVIKMLEENAEEILNFMVSNELVANSMKTALLAMNSKEEEAVRVKVGEVEIQQEKSSKLKGIYIDNDLG